MTLFIPTKQDVINLQVGDLAYNLQGRYSKVEAITDQGLDSSGRYYIDFTTTGANDVHIAGGYTAGTVIPVIQ